ncbi:MAG: hypothetical protein AB1Z98_31865 [Nannocystaceae bacterium]
MNVYIKCDSSTQLYWKQDGTQTWVPLTASSSNAPRISVTSRVEVTFDFIQDASSELDVKFKPTASGVSTPLPATIDVKPRREQLVYFAEDASGTDWYVGYVEVSD